jgi:hypothetical protein
VDQGTEGMLKVVMQGRPDCSYPGGYEICRCSSDGTFLLSQAGTGAWYLLNLTGKELDTFTGSLALQLPAGHRAASIGDNREIMQAAIDEASRMADVLGKLWGMPPMDELQYATVSGKTPFAGTSSQGLILFNDLIFLPAAEYLLPQLNHELGHVWWGTLASGGTEIEFGFFTESLGEYSLWRAKGALEGEARRRDGSRMNAVWYMYRNNGQDVPVLSPKGSQAAIFAIYHKGSTVVRTLEEAAGQKALDAALQEMIKAGQYSATIDGFVDAVKAAGGGDLRPYGPGFCAEHLSGARFRGGPGPGSRHEPLPLQPKIQRGPR